MKRQKTSSQKFWMQRLQWNNLSNHFWASSGRSTVMTALQSLCKTCRKWPSFFSKAQKSNMSLVQLINWWTSGKLLLAILWTSSHVKNGKCLICHFHNCTQCMQNCLAALQVNVWHANVKLNFSNFLPNNHWEKQPTCRIHLTYNHGNCSNYLFFGIAFNAQHKVCTVLCLSGACIFLATHSQFVWMQLQPKPDQQAIHTCSGIVWSIDLCCFWVFHLWKVDCLEWNQTHLVPTIVCIQSMFLTWTLSLTVIVHQWKTVCWSWQRFQSSLPQTLDGCFSHSLHGVLMEKCNDTLWLQLLSQTIVKFFALFGGLQFLATWLSHCVHLWVNHHHFLRQKQQKSVSKSDHSACLIKAIAGVCCSPFLINISIPTLFQCITARVPLVQNLWGKLQLWKIMWMCNHLQNFILWWGTIIFHIVPWHAQCNFDCAKSCTGHSDNIAVQKWARPERIFQWGSAIESKQMWKATCECLSTIELVLKRMEPTVNES